MQDHDSLITREIKRTIWDWVVDHGHTKDCPFFCERYDDASYPLRYACAAFGLFPDAAPVRQVLQTLKLGWYGSHGTRRTLITGHALLPYSPTPAARRILACARLAIWWAISRAASSACRSMRGPFWPRLNGMGRCRSMRSVQR